MFNIQNHSPEVINIQWLEAELNIIFPRVNNFVFKQKKAWNICVNICHQHQTRSGKIKANNKTANFGHNTSLFRKNWTTIYLTTAPSKSFYITFVDRRRRSTPDMFFKKNVLKICRKFAGEHPYRSVISRKLLCNYWNHISAWMFSCKFAAYFQNTFSKEHVWSACSETFLSIWRVVEIVGFF